MYCFSVFKNKITPLIVSPNICYYPRVFICCSALPCGCTASWRVAEGPLQFIVTSTIDMVKYGLSKSQMLKTRVTVSIISVFIHDTNFYFATAVYFYCCIRFAIYFERCDRKYRLYTPVSLSLLQEEVLLRRSSHPKTRIFLKPTNICNKKHYGSEQTTSNIG